MRGGAFLISREIFDNPIWRDITKFRIFFYLLGNAVFSEEGVQKGEIFIGRGQWLISYRNLSRELEYEDNNGEKRYSVSVIKRKVDELVEEGRLKTEQTRLGTLFTIVNYDLYQGLTNYKGGGLEQQKNGERTEKEQGKNNNKNVKNVNNDFISDIDITNDIDNVRDSDSESPEKKSPEKEKPKTYKYDERQMMLAKLLLKKIRENNPKAKEPNLESWANTFRLMMERDGREGKEIQNVILWSQQDSFWYKNILSADKLRKQFDRLYLQMQDELKKRGGFRSEIGSGDVGESQKPKYDFSRRKIL